MLYRVIAEENKSEGDTVRVLNYAPGPLDTEMQREIRESPSAHKETQVSRIFIALLCSLGF